MAQAYKLVEIVAHAGEMSGNSHFGFAHPWNNLRIERHTADIFADIAKSGSPHVVEQDCIFRLVIPGVPYYRLSFGFGQGWATVTAAMFEI